jgi:hypothetical protein
MTMKLHIVKDADDGTPRGIYATKKEAETDIKNLFWDRQMSIETVEIQDTARAVAAFIDDRFGVVLFEN